MTDTPITIKPLEWKPLGEGPDCIASPLPYQIWTCNGGSDAPDDPLVRFNNFRVFEPFMMDCVGDEYLTLSEARSAAQTHFDRIILSAIDMEATVRAIRNEALDADNLWLHYIVMAYKAPVYVECQYKNWRGENSSRRIQLIRVWHGTTEYHPEPCLLLKAWDLDKDQERDFRLSDFDTSTLKPFKTTEGGE